MVEAKGSTGRASGQSAGGKHGSDAKTSSAQATGTSADQTSQADGRGNTPNGLNENTGEFRVGESIIFGMKNGNINIRHSPQGDEVQVAEATLAGLMIDAFFTDKFDGAYPTVDGKPA